MGTGTLRRECGDLGHGDARRGTWGHQVGDAGTGGTGMLYVKYRDMGDTRTLMIIAKVRGKCDLSGKNVPNA